jgi:protein O-GlcNAc transferase
MSESGVSAIRTALERGDAVEAELLARDALELDPEDALLHAYLGSILMARGNVTEALPQYQMAIHLQPEVAAYYNELGNALAACGDFEAAAVALREAAKLSPELPEIYNNLGNVQRASGDRAAAAEDYRQALTLRPEYPEAWSNLGVVLQELDDLDGAEDAYRRAIEIDDGNSFALTHLGVVLAAKGKLTAAESAHRSAMESNPNLPAPYNNLGIVLKDQGRLNEALQAYERAMQMNPAEPSIRSNALLARCCLPNIREDGLFAQHMIFGERVETQRETEFDMSERLEARLRIGYVSPDFYSHSVASFIEPIIEAHDRDEFHVTCYSDVIGGDEVTRRLKASADMWCDTAQESDEELYQRILADKIDILVDLSGHTGDNRLPVFARRAAPVQVSWIGYPATTGLSRMDYRITDRWADPEGDADRWHSESLLRLECGFLCYRAPNDAILPEKPEDAALTFGSFNNFAKINEEVLDVWAALLRAEPAARLLLKCRQLADDGVRRRLVEAFGARSVSADRLLLHGRVASRTDHLALYGAVDVALDTFPYNGTTTTCEALWMGVPVVTMTGSRHATRVGESLLRRGGWDAWVARSTDEYVEIACELVRNRPTPSEVRDQLASSSVMDGKVATAALETSYREIWRRRREGDARS